MAIEKVYILNNTGVIVDEVLAQRLGLVPIRADPTQFQYKEGDGDPPTDLNTIVFRLKKVAPGRYKNQSDASDSPISFASTPVYSGDLVWVPQGIQQEKFDNSEIGVVHKNILIAKLAAGHEIELEAHCQKGIGKEHAKWSPATSHYRLMPVITILSPITGDLAYKFQKCFSSGTIEVFKNRKGLIISMSSGAPALITDNGFPRLHYPGELEAKVLDASKDTGSREVLRHPEFEGKVLLARKRDHYICKSVAGRNFE